MRNRHSRLGLVSLFGLALAGSVAFVACQSTTDTASGGAAGGGAGGEGSGDGGVVTLGSCQFGVVARPEYQQWEAPAPTDTAAAPNIRRVRLGLGGNLTMGQPGYADPATSFGVAWQTDDGTKASMVRWGSSADPSTWPAANVANGVTWVTQGAVSGERMHEAYVCGLSPATTYYYQVGGGPAGAEQWSDVYALTTTPSDPNAKVTFAITGDSRGEQNNAWQILQQRVLTKGVTMQLFSGDMINLAPDQNEWEEWIDKAWKDPAGKLSSLGQVLTLAAHGNHDNHNVLFFGNLTLPQDVNQYPQYSELFFSVNVGPTHVVVLDDQWLISTSGDQNYKPTFESWLKADLTAANAARADRPWIIAIHHHPEYSSSSHGKDADVLRGRAYLAPLWDQFHVDLVLNGHDHDYERSKPLSGDPSNPTVGASPGTTYLVCAGSGAEGYANGTSNFTAQSAAYDGTTTIGTYGLLEATKASLHLTAHFLTADGSDPVIEDVTLTK